MSLALVALLTLLASGALSLCLVAALLPVLRRYALSHPNARSSHAAATPQGGGIAVVAASLGVAAAAWAGAGLSLAGFVPVAVAAAAIAAVGLLDDLRGVPATLRLVAQGAAVALALAAAPDGARLLPASVPLALERGLELAAGLWFVNLVNFMDGIDWMSVAEAVPVAAALAGLGGWLGMVDVAILGAALAGAMLGFAPFNRPVARLFLGDVGSLALGLLLGWMLYRLALAGGLAAAFILPLYYLADATLTLARRLARGERVWMAHRTHYYQRATDNGFSVLEVVARVFLLNLGLAFLALATLLWPPWPVTLGSLAAAAALVGLTLRRFATPRRFGRALA